MLTALMMQTAVTCITNRVFPKQRQILQSQRTQCFTSLMQAHIEKAKFNEIKGC